MENFKSGIYIEEKALFDYAASSARLLQCDGTGSAAHTVKTLQHAMREIKRSHAAVEKRGEDANLPSACRWLLDNLYMAKREYLAAVGAFRQAKELRHCKDGALILCLARSLLSASHGKITEDRCRLFLDGFQSVTVLRRFELELFTSALKGATLEALAYVSKELCRAAEPEALEESFASLFGTLRLLSVLDAERLISGADISGAILAADPTGDFSQMDSGTKRLYLNKLQSLAKKWGMEEHQAASELIRQAKQRDIHVGFLLFEKKSQRPALCYIGANLGLTLIISLYIALYFDSPGPALLLLLPVSELVKNLIDFVLLHIVSPSPMSRMDTTHGIPTDGKSLCVISALLTDEGSAAQLAKKLERFYLSCRKDPNLSFGLLADLKAANTQSLEDDRQIISAAQTAVNALNRKYGGGFYLFTRERSFDGESFSGHERKRGAITELARLLSSEPSTLNVQGDTDRLHGTRYIISLDADTEVYPCSLPELIGAMLHPLNRPVIENGIVTRGHGIIHPRISNSLSSAHGTDFSIIFSGNGGSDPYGSLCGELYMDAFSSGGFAGKGIIDVGAFLECVADRFPEGRVLSHDALEGAYLSGGYMGDLEFCDAFPEKPLDYYKRQHRWVRGDWQNAPWIFKKELRPIERWRLFDSLRRSLIAPATLLALLMGFYFPEKAIAAAAWAALLALLSRLLLCFAEESVKQRPRNNIPLRRYTRVLTGAGGAIVQTFMRLWLLPFEAWVNLSAACTALWRMLVTHKKLLQWQTAAQLKSGGFADHIRSMLPAEALGFILLLTAPGIMGRASGLMWLLSSAAATALSLPAKKPLELSKAHREYLKDSLKGSWQYLAKFSSTEDNYLPPDNYQEQPAVGVAHRSSPTNMGFAMASAVAACDMGLCEKSDAIDYMERLCGTLEKLPRCIGHFYNWYDTRTLQPLEPAFVSTVDSGNMYAGLLVSKIALTEWGERELSERIERLMEPMDFAPLFDKSRKLFYICYDSRKKRGAGGWYDLMASEAMLTSYIAIAKGDVPVKHWRRLSRAQLQQDGYRGLASWTGTMFEYLMPELFLPFYRGSLLWESGRFCLYAQKKRAFAGKPWGISESAFYSLDSSLSYRYKAHGAPALALKRGQDEDMVISPYSTYLALAVSPQSAVKNLHRLELMGAKGRFGFIEALDFTPNRCRKSSGEKVSCYMAHHVGMSLLSGANALCDNSVCRRFMSEPAMAAHSLLLQEQLPTDTDVLRRDSDPGPQRPPRSSASPWKLRSQENEDAMCLLSNGVYQLLGSSHGQFSASLNKLCIYRSLSLQIFIDNKYHPIFPDPHPMLWELGEDSIRIKSSIGFVNCQSHVQVAAGEFGEGRTFSLSSSEDCYVGMSLSFLPILANLQDYVNHPSFWKLGLQAKRQDNFVLLRRLRRGDMPELWLCAGFDKPMDTGTLGWLQDALELRLRIKLEKGGRKELRYALCVASSEEEAIEGARRILAGCDAGCMVSAAASRLEMTAAETGAAMALLPDILEPKLKAAAAKKELWQYGISGDRPIISCPVNAAEALSLLKQFCLLKSCGIDADLVYLSPQQGEYRQPAHKLLRDALAKAGLEELIGESIHFLPMSAQAHILSRSCFAAGHESPDAKPLSLPALSAPRRRAAVPEHHWADGSFNYYVNLSLPSRSWQHILSNGSFGAIVRDCGMACMWQDNAREMPIVSTPEHIGSVESKESLYLQTQGKSISLFAANDGCECKVSFTPGMAQWEKKIGSRCVKTSVFIPMGIDARIIIIKGGEGLNLRWCMEPSMGSPAGISCESKNGSFSCRSSESYFEGLEFHALSSGFAAIKADYLPAAMELSTLLEKTTVLVCGCAAVDSLRELCRPDAAMSALEECTAHWQQLLGRVEVSTGMESLDHYMNHWAAYQTIACRLWGRSSLYQSGGAIGFRDQLQDAVNMLLLEPSFAKEQILDCCRHQYEQGDVMHWWHRHPSGDKGIRSRCSDDLLWLPWALCEYTEATGDMSICSIDVNYVNSPILSDHERDRYEIPEIGKSGIVLEHAQAALDCCLDRGFGPHGLPFIGSGDWNDGLDAVDGESVWLAWFLSICANKLSALLEKLCKPEFEHYRSLARSAAEAADKSWNGRFYRRGYLSDGRPLGGEKRIDSLPQSFAAFCPYADREKVKKALKLSVEKLVDRDAGIVKLFDPPFGDKDPYYGYISSYGEGFRENGGQYTHAAIWLAMACFEMGMRDEGFEILSLLLPENHDADVYGAEPFVLAADVYSAMGHRGEAGWTWYTGSAGWYFRAVTENMLGLKLQNGRLKNQPRLPDSLRECKVLWKGSEINIKFTN